jgi:hypothetical protein
MSKGVIQSFRAVASRGRRALSFAWREPQTAWLILRMAAWVVGFSLMLKFLPLPRALKIIRPRRRAVDYSHIEATLQSRLARAVDMLLGVNCLVFKPICWKRAAVLYRYLALNGIETRIIFGLLSANAEALIGHAWLEVGGKPVLEPTPPQYTVTYAFPA